MNQIKKIYAVLIASSTLALAACNNDDDNLSPHPNVSVPTLVGFARLNVDTFATGPSSGAAIKGANGFKPPFQTQPVQGFSAALKNADGSYMAMADNGFGTQDNSADFLLRIYQLKPDFKAGSTQTTAKSKGSGKVEVMGFIQLRDPNHKIPFPIINQGTAERLLTGADFDPESMQRAADGSYWIGDEFGPYLLHFDATGVLLDAPFVLPNPLQPDQELRSPQNQFNKANINYVAPLVQQSGGFEGMALSADSRYLYPILEKPLLGDSARRVLISQFDLEKKAYTGQYYWYDLDANGGNIGDFQMINDRAGIIIERDTRQNKLDAYKKLIHVELNASGQAVTRRDLVDLMNLANPNLLFGAAREGDIGVGEKFSFPFETIENIIIENKDTLTVINDNNFPFSSGRNAKRADDNEIIQIKLPKPLY